MKIDPERHRELEDARRRLSRGLVLALVLGALAFLGLVIWFLRMGGSMWG